MKIQKFEEFKYSINEMKVETYLDVIQKGKERGDSHGRKLIEDAVNGLERELTNQYRGTVIKVRHDDYYDFVNWHRKVTRPNVTAPEGIELEISKIILRGNRGSDDIKNLIINGHPLNRDYNSNQTFSLTIIPGNSLFSIVSNVDDRAKFSLDRKSARTVANLVNNTLGLFNPEFSSTSKNDFPQFENTNI